MIQVGDYIYPIHTPFVIPGSPIYYAIIVYQNVTAINACLLHMATDCIMVSIFICIVYQTTVLGYRFSKLGNPKECKGQTHLNCMKKMIDLIKLQFKNEKYLVSYYKLEIILKYFFPKGFERCSQIFQFGALHSNWICFNVCFNCNSNNKCM